MLKVGCRRKLLSPEQATQAQKTEREQVVQKFSERAIQNIKKALNSDKYTSILALQSFPRAGHDYEAVSPLAESGVNAAIAERILQAFPGFELDLRSNTGWVDVAPPERPSPNRPLNDVSTIPGLKSERARVSDYYAKRDSLVAQFTQQAVRRVNKAVGEADFQRPLHITPELTDKIRKNYPGIEKDVQSGVEKAFPGYAFSFRYFDNMKPAVTIKYAPPGAGADAALAIKRAQFLEGFVDRGVRNIASSLNRGERANIPVFLGENIRGQSVLDAETQFPGIRKEIEEKVAKAFPDFELSFGTTLQASVEPNPPRQPVPGATHSPGTTERLDSPEALFRKYREARANAVEKYACEGIKTASKAARAQNYDTYLNLVSFFPAREEAAFPGIVEDIKSRIREALLPHYEVKFYDHENPDTLLQGGWVLPVTSPAESLR